MSHTYTYEIFLRHAQIDKSAWREFILAVARFFHGPVSWHIFVTRSQNVIHYFIATPKPLPTSLDLTSFLLGPCEQVAIPTAQRSVPYRNSWAHNFIAILHDLSRRQFNLHLADLSFFTFQNFVSGKITLYLSRGSHRYTRRLLLFSPQTFLSIDFTKSQSFLFKKFPKHLKLEKVTKLLTPAADGALLEIDPFPYLQQTQFLRHDSFDFAKHSLVIGSSGSGKSRFLASLITKIAAQNSEQYKVVVIDPHDALYQDCTAVSSQTIINFQDAANSIDLFGCQAEDINVQVELMLSLFQSLLGNSYNGRLERVLRHATYLLVTAGSFSFITLRQLLLDLEYRSQVVQQYQTQVPVSVTHFFLTDFNELRSQNYNDAIAPIIAFIDEMQIVPIFNNETKLSSLAQQVRNNFLSIFSLNRLKLGNRVVQTIAGLLMQQLFLLAEHRLDQHLIIIIDEVAVIENPIISRFLSELRKYRTTVILASQFFDQISHQLQSAIFANVTNFYLFRVSQSDAATLTRNLKIQVVDSENPADAEKLLTSLNARECLVRISKDEELFPIFKARTTDFVAPPIIENALFQSNSQKISGAENIQNHGLENKQKFSQVQNSQKLAKITENKNNKNFSPLFPHPISSNYLNSHQTSEDFCINDVDPNIFLQNYSTSRKTNKTTKEQND